MSLTEQFLRQIPGQTLDYLRFADQRWSYERNDDSNVVSVPLVVENSNISVGEKNYDVIICGGTLGILLAAALQRQGWRICLIEKGILRGRDQEWNISRQELTIFLDLELLSEAELEQAIATQYNPARVSFHQGYELWVKDVLNIGVNPVFLLETLKQKFVEAGGTLFEKTPFTSVTVHPDGVTLQAGDKILKTRLLIDAMGHFSPIAKQARNGVKPDGVCLVVGSCAKGYPNNETGDLIATFTPILHQCQYFWEAFPARDGRTTYLFTYLDPHPERFSLEFLMEEYLRLLPEYQQVDLGQLNFERFLFGFFPSYRQSPLKMPWSRILAVGDSSGSQSPVSFGGFGAMVRHLKRLTFGIDEALKIDTLDQKSLATLQPYQPNISVTWLFQRTMMVKMNQKIAPNQINDLMSGVFKVMDQLGDDVLKPFLQDVVQFSSLSKTLPLVNPKLVFPMLPDVGIMPLADWLLHYFNLALYSGLYPVAKSFQGLENQLSPQQKYYYHRWLERLKYGSGNDYQG
ncbi:FAD-dependent oxidoreductase [Aphanothece hegewaldii CCALA 016]|uniref:FAD-dependent oxidoreductase n=1 Tax=Aphanothece hegewaldii CCALA 016 TaxID=2107694 RepID=A0A2T1LY06_9CHRO|nr:lycopene cyclase family protein [Aphanothece hegewaldii]PSF37256.1 FAD-dependent oxidoreductase [Aphanothece hegewaldii CCALA 016]